MERKGRGTGDEPFRHANKNSGKNASS